MSLKSKKKIMIITSGGFSREWAETIKRHFSDDYFSIVEDNKESIHHEISNVSAIIGCPRHLFSKEFLVKAGPGLEWIHASGAGVEEFLIPEFVNSSIIFTNGKIIQGPEVSDHAMALLLTMSRNIHWISSGKGPRPLPRPIELKNKTAVVFGVGGIGLLLVEKLKAFGMYTIAVDEDYLPITSFIDEAVLTEDLMEHLPKADVVICCCPNTERSRFTFDLQVFNSMKKNTFFINVSRGQLVKTGDLVEVLERGHLRGVGLDVTDPEPLPEGHPLLQNDRVLITPHVAGPSDHNRERSLKLIKSNIKRFISGSPLLNIVNKKNGH